MASALAKVSKKEIVDRVHNRVNQLIDSKKLTLPGTYSLGNAMSSAFLKLQETLDRNQNPVLEVCTQTSISNALLKMAVQGLNPAKDQCYFIAYGKTLTLQRSYLGSMAVALRVPGVKRIEAQIVYEGDSFLPEIIDGIIVIKEHKISWENMAEGKIKGAYCTVFYDKDADPYVELMTMEQIKQAWKQSKMNPVLDNGDIKKGSVHDKFTTEMVKKTVINRACKKIINSSDDSNILVIQDVENEEAELITHEEIEGNANTVEFGEAAPSRLHEVDEQGQVEPHDPVTGEILDDSKLKPIKVESKSNNSKPKVPTEKKKTTVKKEKPVNQTSQTSLISEDDDCPF